ncbi:hypothetical protein NM74_07905 [Aeromonas hydrophila]|uniref:hypothetical protein n=1 Tax=Aeromonas hydrophila TaxID=644 RepID=UPI000537EED6|nr:hypothetical protein [Aeromonas hydrophila]KHA57134.1 hypothetical protein NM74_07905 [Aeromonas hydrophila]
MKLTSDRNTPLMDATAVSIPAKGDQVIFGGSLVCVDADGFAVPGAATAGLTYAGRAEGKVNSAGKADGEVQVLVRRKTVFKWANDGTVLPANLMQPVFVLDDQTVAAAGDVQVGIAVRLDNDGVWVE